MKTRFPVIPVLAVLILVACGSPRKLRGPFEVWERTVITMSDSVMYVFVKSEFMDSIELRAHCRDLSDEELQSDLLPMLAAKMRATLRSPQQGGVGLAAPQVGIHRRIVAIQRLDKPGEPIEVYANLHVLEHLGDTVRGPEGCLSIPGKRGIVPRFEGVIVRWTDPETLRTVTDTVHGFTAIIFQHEADHLDGVFYTDKADTVWTDEAWLAERAPYEAAGAYVKPRWLYGGEY